MTKTHYLNLLLLPAFFLLHNNNVLFGFMLWQQVLIFISITTLLTIACFFLLKKLLKVAPVAALATLLVQLFILFFGPFHDFIKSVAAGSVVSSYKVVVPVIIILTGLLTRYFFKNKETVIKFSRSAFTVLLVLCIYEITVSGINLYNLSANKNLIYPQQPVCDSYTSCNLPDSSKPDIYFLVLDEYTNNNTLQKLWNFENIDVTNWLTANGFYVIPRSHANYTSTSFSVSSTLNMNYISKKNSKGTIRNYLRSNKSLSYNETFCLLQKEGYTIRFLAPYKNDIEKNGLIDYTGYMHNNWLFMHTFFGRFNRDILWHFRTGRFAFRKEEPGSEIVPWSKRRENIRKTIDKIKATADLREHTPKFVYGHLMITHDPHVFDSTGAARKEDTSKPFDTYTQQIIYANTVIKDLVSHIRRNNKKNTVIIIEGDHGFRLFPVEMKEYFFPNFSAVYFPDSIYHQLYPGMSPVNTFRVVFNHYFCQNLPLLKDSSILITDYD